MNDTFRRRASSVVLLGIALLLGAVAASRWQPWTFLFRDGSFYAQTNRAIATEGSLRQERVQPRSWYDGSLPWYRNVDDAWSNVSVGKDGEWYPKHSVLMPVLSTPLYLALGPGGLLVFNLVALGLGLFAGYRLAARAVGEFPAAVATWAVASTPLVATLAYAYSHDVFYGALVAGAAATLAGGRFGFAGVLAGLAVVAKPTNVVILLPVGLALFRGGWRQALRVVAGGAVPVAAYAVANWAMYGAPWLTSYHRILVVTNGVQQIVSYQNAFDLPLAEGMARFFQRSVEGEVWQTAAVAVVAYAGVVPLAFRSPRWAAGWAAALAAFAGVFAVYRYGGGRFFLPLLMLAPVPGAALLDALGGVLGAVPGACARLGATRWARWALALLLAALVAGFGAAWMRSVGAAGPGATMAASLESLEVRAGDTPCDYFNLAHRKWECSGIDRDDGLFTGQATGEQCEGAGARRLRIPPGPAGRDRSVTWRPGAAGGSLVLDVALDAKGPPLDVSVTVGEAEAWSGKVTSTDPRSLPLAVPVAAGQPVLVRVGPAGARGAACIDLAVVP